MKVGDIHIEEVVFEKTKDLLLKFGVKGWNMNDLAEACGMSKRTLYKIIGTKEDLLLTVNKNSISNNNARIEKYLQSKKPFPTVLADLSKYIIDGFDDYTLNHIKAIRLEYPSIKAMESESLKKHRNLFTQFFQKGIDESNIAPHLTAVNIEKTLHALIEYHISNCNSKIEFKKEMDDVLSVFFKGIVN